MYLYARPAGRSVKPHEGIYERSALFQTSQRIQLARIIFKRDSVDTVRRAARLCPEHVRDENVCKHSFFFVFFF